MNKSKGFTIIELLVVIAIIAVLAAIVLVNVTQYINKGKDAAIKGNMSTILTNSAVRYDECGSYGTGAGACTLAFTGTSGYTVPKAAVDSAGKAVTPGTITAGDKFCACATLYEIGKTYCIDSSGYKKTTATVCGTRCPDAAAAGAGVCID